MSDINYHDPALICEDLRAMRSVVADNAAELIEELVEARELLCRPSGAWHHMLCSDFLCCHGDWHWPHHCTHCRFEISQEHPHYCAVCGPETRFATPQQLGDHIWRDNHARAEHQS